jgi:AhpD family alkylhydroperoxidase
MSELTERDRELVAIGAAIGSNCIPCIAFHVGKARDAGLGDGEIQAAVALSEEIRAVPAALVVSTARAYLDSRPQPPGSGECGCQDPTPQSLPESHGSCGCGR